MSYKVVVFDDTLYQRIVTFNQNMADTLLKPYSDLKDKIKKRAELPDEDVVMFYFDSDADLIVVANDFDYNLFERSGERKIMYAFGNDKMKLSEVDLNKRVSNALR